MSIDPSTTTTPTLSDRELEVLKLVATGATNNQVARELAISVNTVKVHLNNIFTKLGVQSRTEATMVAVRRGWVHVARDASEVATTEIVSPAPVAVDTTAAEAVSLAPTGAEVVMTSVVMPTPGANETAAEVVSTRAHAARRNPWRIVAIAVVIGLLGGLVIYAPGLRDRFGPASANLPGPAASISNPERWQTKATLGAPRESIAVATVNGLVYAIGGLSGGDLVADVNVYDPVSNQWASRAAKPTPLQAMGAAVVGGRIYLPGGCDATNTPSSIVEVYDPQQDTWQTAASLPQALCHYAIGAMEGKLYLFGGWNGKQAVSDVLVFDPSRDEWSSGPALPTPRADAAAALVNDRIYVAGGRNGDSLYAQMLVFDPTQAQSGKSWTEAAPLAHPRAGLGLAALAGNLYAIGGGWTAALKQNERFDTRTNAWSPLEDAPETLWRVGGVAAIETKLYVIGGFSGSPTAAVEEYTALYRFFLPNAPAGN